MKVFFYGFRVLTLASVLLFCLQAVVGAADKTVGPQGNERQQKKLQAKIKKQLRRGRGDFFVVAVSETTFHRSLYRKLPTGLEVKSAGPGQFLPRVTVEFHMKEGLDPTVDFLAGHLLKYVHPKRPGTRRSRRSTTTRLPAGHWRLVGRFKDGERANAVLKNVQAAYNMQNREWR